MKTITAIAANKLGNFLTRDFRQIFGSTSDDMAERIGSAARSTIECLARSDALYHNYEHTLQVTMVGRDILHGMMVHERIEAEDYGHLIAACLFHDMGNIIKSDLKKFPEFLEPEGLEYWDRVKKEYVEKYGKDEHAATVAIARAIPLKTDSITLRN